MNTLVPVSKNIPCPLCKSESVVVITYSDTVDFRNMELDVENLQKSKCNNCGHKWTTNEQRNHNNSVMRNAYVVVRDQLRTKHGMLTGQEIAQVRERFGIHQREAAVIFGGGYNAFNKYESGEVLQSFAMDRLLRLSAAVGESSIEFLKNVFEPPNFFVVSTSRPNEVRITIGGGGLFKNTAIRGASETDIQKLEQPRELEQLVRNKSLPIAH
jgi:putative zinc finger/helix-turn-helix YgiT family protein